MNYGYEIRIQEGVDFETDKKNMFYCSSEDGWGDLCYRGFPE
jgi:hypothetical protein